MVGAVACAKFNNTSPEEAISKLTEDSKFTFDAAKLAEFDKYDWYGGVDNLCKR